MQDENGLVDLHNKGQNENILVFKNRMPQWSESIFRNLLEIK